MVGVFATGKTSLVQQYVFSMFSEKYHSTVGVKIDRRRVEIDGTTVNLVLWDLAGRDGFEDVQTSYLRGASGILFVADGTRRETFDQAFDLHERIGVGERRAAVLRARLPLQRKRVLVIDRQRAAGQLHAGAGRQQMFNLQLL